MPRCTLFHITSIRDSFASGRDAPADQRTRSVADPGWQTLSSVFVGDSGRRRRRPTGPQRRRIDSDNFRAARPNTDNLSPDDSALGRPRRQHVCATHVRGCFWRALRAEWMTSQDTARSSDASRQCTAVSQFCRRQCIGEAWESVLGIRRAVTDILQDVN